MKIRDKYEVLELVGEGGNGAVYKVREDVTQRILAVKEIRLRPGKEAEVKREAYILQTCFHPSLPVVLEQFREGEYLYIVMEYVEGITLKEYVLKNGRLSGEKVLHFAKKIGEVLLYLHSRNPAVIYGDLKPQNIMVTAEEEIRLIDFGTAGDEDGKLMPAAEKEKLKTERLERGELEKNGLGCYASPGYAAPEQLRGRSADNRSDIYSFGAVLHYLLTGEDPELPPYVRRDLRECDAALSVGICWAVGKCLKELPEERYQSMERVLYDLQHFTKKEKKRRLINQGKQAVQTFLFLVFAGFFYRAFENWQWGVTWKENSFLLPAAVSLFVWCLWRGIMIGGKGTKKYGYQLEKNIWKTDKKGVGLFAVLLVLGLWGLEIGVNAKEAMAPLSVTIYDEAGYKLLWRENQRIPLSGAFRLEIPEECFEAGEDYEITVILSEKKTGDFRSRKFDVKSVKSSIEN